ncbi:MAG: hypothetical protein K0U98_04510 [Deltaproteobacteria bacterium]|nr:hypothetical protein [Deltaproteobacteria bacterium]
MSRPASLEPLEYQKLTSLGERPWIDIWVFFDPETATLEVETPGLPVPVGWPVRWRFRSRRSDGVIGPLPAGWSPALAFDAEDGGIASSPFGPFESFLQIGLAGEGEALLMDLVGEWPGGCSVPPAKKDFPYIAMLHRGQGFEQHKALSRLSTSRQTLSLRATETVGTLYHRPLSPEEHSVELSVRRCSPDKPRLTLEPKEPESVFANSVVRWRFDQNLDPLLPLILFSHFEEKCSDQNQHALEPHRKNQYFAPCRRMRLHRTGVEAWDFKAKSGRFYYEAVTLSSWPLSVQMFSTGDSQLHNEGIPSPGVKDLR